MKFAAFFGHLGLLFGFLAIVLMLYPMYIALDPQATPSSALVFPLVLWSIGLLFVLGEYYEIKHPD